MQRIYVRNGNTMLAFNVSGTAQQVEDLLCGDNDMDHLRENLETKYSTCMDAEGGTRPDGLGEEGGWDLPDMPGKRRAEKMLIEIRDEVQRLRPTWVLGPIAIVP